MDISFRTGGIQKICSQNAVAQRKLGAKMARKLQQRMMELKAAVTLTDISRLPPARCHQLSGNRAGQLSIDLEHPYRLLFIPANDPVPKTTDGGLDWVMVTEIEIIEIADTLWKMGAKNMLKATKLYGFEPDYAVPPGETLKEVMVSLDMTQKGLAVRTGLTVQSLNRIFKGEQPITYETANKLELATGVPSGMWNNLEAQYREQLAKIKERDQLEADLGWLKTIPVRELIQRGAMEAAKDKVAQLRTVLKFYGVSSVGAWQDIWEQPAVASRRSQCFESCPGPASAWIRLGELQAQQIECRPYDKATFARAVNEMRLLTTKEPEAFVPEMVRLCADAGVALCLVPEMKKVPWHGATKWISPSKAMILLNLRGKAEDQFWFSFFHEAGHVLNDSKKDLLINDGTSDDPREAKANAFAANLLIPVAYDPPGKRAWDCYRHCGGAISAFD